MDDVLIVGGGIAGFSLALALHRHGLRCRLFEVAPVVKPVGAGLNLLPHAVAALSPLGVVDEIGATAVETYDLLFLNRHGQLIHREFRGRYNGHAWPQYSVHRADLHAALLGAFRKHIGTDRLHLGCRCVGVEQDDGAVSVRVQDSRSGRAVGHWTGMVAIACDGINSTIRRQFYPHEGDPLYAGVATWRGVAPMPRLLSGASMVLAGSLRTGKLVIYPVHRHLDGEERQLLNWMAEIRTDAASAADWDGQESSIEHIERLFGTLSLPLISFAEILRRTRTILRFPMVDRDPLDRWTFGRVTLLGDAAHPMYPFGSNGACQAILDAVELARCLAQPIGPQAALSLYEANRRPATREVVLLNRKGSPDEILEEVDRRTAGQPFRRLCDVISSEEIDAISSRYKLVAGFARPARGRSAEEARHRPFDDVPIDLAMSGSAKSLHARVG